MIYVNPRPEMTVDIDELLIDEEEGPETKQMQDLAEGLARVMNQYPEVKTCNR